MKSKTQQLSPLKTTHDFTELLSLTELSVQMEVLTFLQENLYEYQLNYLKSFFKTIDEIINHIPERDYKKYFDHRECPGAWTKKDWDSPWIFKGIEAVLEYYTEDRTVGQVGYDPEKFDQKKNNRKVSSICDEYYLMLNTKSKEVYRVNKSTLKHFKFFKKKNHIECVLSWTSTYGSSGQFNTGYIVTNKQRLIISICMKTNQVIGFTDEWLGSDSQKIGWASDARQIKTKTVYE